MVGGGKVGASVGSSRVAGLLEGDWRARELRVPLAKEVEQGQGKRPLPRPRAESIEYFRAALEPPVHLLRLELDQGGAQTR